MCIRALRVTVHYTVHYKVHNTCRQPYLRWSCEAPVSGLPDIGYACTSDFTAEVLYGDVDRTAPCDQCA